MNMTLSNNLLPLAALAVAGVGILIFHLTDFDQKGSRGR